MEAARQGGFASGEAYRRARDRGFSNANEVRAAEAAGFEQAEAYRVARRSGFTTKKESDEATARGFATADARDEATSLGFETAAAHDAATRSNWRDAAEMERGTRIGFRDGRTYRLAMAGGFAHAKPYELAVARGFSSQSDVLEADRLGYRTADSMERGVEGGFTGGDEYRQAAAQGFAIRANWLRARDGGFATARDLSDADDGGYRDMAELTAGRDGGFEDAKALRAARDAGFSNAAQVADATKLGYRTASDMRAGREGGFANAKKYRAARARGFTSRADMLRAEAAGFRSAGARDAAAAAGFATMAALEAARADGFDRADDHKAFSASGFRSRYEFMRARESGHATLTSALEDATGRLDDAQRTARDVLSDIDLFGRRAALARDTMVEVVTGVGVVNTTLTAEVDRADLDAIEDNLATLVSSTARLLQSLEPDPSFVAFRKQREDERAVAGAQRLADARQRLETTRDATTTWVSANLLHPGAPSIIAMADEIAAALASDDADAMLAVDETVRLAALEHDADIGTAMAGSEQRRPDMLANETSPTDVDSVETSSVGSTAAAAGRRTAVAITDSNRFLVEGPGSNVIALYNVGLDIPNVVIDILGDVRFRDDRASACGIGVSFDGAEGRHLRAVLRDAGINELTRFGSCKASSLNRVDLVIVRRDNFLTANTNLADRVLSSIETATLRRFEPLTSEALDAVAALEATLLGEITIDLAAGGRTGFGAVALSERGPFCAVADGLVDHTAPLEAEPVARERLMDGPSEATLDGAYRASQRGGCATIYASGKDLSKLIVALQRDGRDHSILPFWIGEDRIAAERQSRETNVLERERAIAASEREGASLAAIAAEREAEAARTRAALTAAMRAENGPQARELVERIDAALDDMVTNCPACAAREGDAVTGLFPGLSNWYASRTQDDDWEVRDFVHEIAEYGDVDHQSRTIRAIVIRVNFDLASPGRGARETECHVLGAAWDGEFNRWRDPFSAPCGADAGKREITGWVRGYALTSLWTASEADVGILAAEKHN